MRPSKLLRRLALLSTLASCGLAILLPGTALAGTCNVSGDVTDSNLPAGNNAPAGSVSVTLKDLTNPSAASISGVAEAGLWAADGLTSTDYYEAIFTGADYQSATTRPFVCNDYDGSAFDAVLTPLTATIQVTVTDDESGFGISGAEFEVTGNISGNEWLGSTDSDGGRSISVPADEKYSIAVSATDYTSDSLAGFAVSPSTPTGIESPLTPTKAEITGTVTDPGAAPVADVHVIAFNPDRSSTDSTVTNDRGQYALTGLANGSYTVEFVPDDSAHVWQYYTGNAGGTEQASSAVLVPTSAGSVATHINATVEQGASISGTVTNINGAPIAGATVSIKTPSGGGLNVPNFGTLGASATTGADGKYTVSGLPAGSYTALAQDGTGYVDTYFGPSTTAAQATTIGLAANASSSNINITLAPGGTISGTVTLQSSGAPLADVYIELYSGGNEVSANDDAADGTYSFAGLAPGTYQLYFVAADDNAVWTWLGGTSTQAASRSVTLPQGGTATANQALIAGSEITGTVTDGVTGEPESGVTVTVYDSNGNFAGASTDTATNGAYAAGPFAPGTYRVEFNPYSSLAWQYYHGAASLDGATVVTLSASGNTTGIDATLTPGGTVSGTVTDAASGTPLDDMFVDLLDPSGFEETSTMTGDDGSYKFTGVPAGSFVVEFEGGRATGVPGIYQTQYGGGSQTLAGSKPVSVSAGQNSTVDAAMNTATTAAQTTTVTVTTPAPSTTTTQTVTPPQPTAPALSGGKLGGVARNRVALSFNLAEGKNGAPGLKLVDITLPKGFSFVAAKLKKDLVLTRGVKYTFVLSRGVLKITLRTAQKSLSVSLRAGAISVTPALKLKALKHTLASTKVSVTVVDARNLHTSLSYTIKKPT